MIIPLFVGRDSSIQAVEDALSKDRLIFLTTQKNIHQEYPSPEGLYHVGTIGMIMRMRKLPDSRLKILVQGVAKGKIDSFLSTDPYFKVQLDRVIEEPKVEITQDILSRMSDVKDLVNKLIHVGKVIPPDMNLILDEINEPGRLADVVASSLGLKVPESQLLLETTDPVFRLSLVLEYLKKEFDASHSQPKMKPQKSERSPYDYLSNSPKDPYGGMRGEYESDPKADEIAELRFKLEQKGLPEEVETEAFKQLQRLERMHPDASEASVIRTYIDWIIEVPWTEKTEDNHDLVRARKILDEDHYNLQKVKERILEFLAVSKLKKDMRGPILCFSGAPGVGKTSLGKSIARCLGRKFVRVSLGGVRDEAEIRGHRRTYVGAMPGKVIQALKQSASNNPVFILDEIDKLGADFRGDPASALLEVLDPEQNHDFRDHYLNLPFNLSNTLFITTANVVDNIPPALRDRLEIIQIAGYTEEEKLQIARRHLIRRQVKENGLQSENIKFTADGIKKMIREYTQEAGLRTLERKIATVCRKVAKDIALGEMPSLPTPPSTSDSEASAAVVSPPLLITPKKVEKYLGKPEFVDEGLDQISRIGISNGLAWTPFGGQILQIEAIKIPSRKAELVLTGQLGDIMKESAKAAYSFIQSNAEKFQIDSEDFAKYDVHLHVPAGAIPKDGPSAGITIATAMLSLFTGIPIRHDVAMTGEITLRGRVLMIGGLKEKSLAALRHDIHHIIVPEGNYRDISEMPPELRRKITFHRVRNIMDVFEIALERSPYKKPLAISSRPAEAA
jgi:ATP-dependent Lon protease